MPQQTKSIQILLWKRTVSTYWCSQELLFLKPLAVFILFQCFEVSLLSNTWHTATGKGRHINGCILHIKDTSLLRRLWRGPAVYPQFRGSTVFMKCLWSYTCSLCTCTCTYTWRYYMYMSLSSKFLKIDPKYICFTFYTLCFMELIWTLSVYIYIHGMIYNWINGTDTPLIILCNAIQIHVNSNLVALQVLVLDTVLLVSMGFRRPKDSI